MRPGRLSIAFAIGIATLLFVPGASADPASDYAAVKSDYEADHDITACKFSKDQLVNARNLITTQDDAYEPGFRDEVNVEINRWDSGGCGSGGGGGGGGGPTANIAFHITKIKGKVRARGKRRARARKKLTEYVRLQNKGDATLDLKGWALRNSRGQLIYFRTSVPVGAHRLLRVVTGCVRGHRRAFRRGSRFYACRRRQFWKDSGDLAQVLTPRGFLFSQRGYGRFGSARKF